MKINDDILQELAAIAPKLASIDRTNCFAVPEGYFIDGLPESFTLNDLENVGLDPANKNKVFVKPVEDDADLTYLNVISEIIIEPYQYLKDEALYTIPEHYFDILPTLIMNELNGEVLLPNQLNQNLHQSEYKIPANYFKELPQNILQKVKQESEEAIELNALLKQMQQEGVYQVPPQYFATLGETIWSNITKVPATTTTAKRITLQPFKRVFALAAMFALFVAGFWLIQTNQSASFDMATQFAQLNNQDIKEYISENSFNFNESNLVEVTGNIEDDLFQNIEILPEDYEFYLDLDDLDVNLINNNYNNERTFDI